MSDVPVSDEPVSDEPVSDEPVSDEPVSAVQAEATGVETITVDWGGVPLTFPAQVDDLELDTLEALESGKGVTFIRGMLGSKVYEAAKVAFKKANGRAPRASDVKSLMDQVAIQYGFEDAGE